MTQRTDDTPETHRPIESREDLLSVFADGEKAPERWRIGTEHEKFVYRLEDHRAPSFDEPGGIRDLLNGLRRFGWKPVTENGNVIALSGPDGTISLEPAGQFELSGAALETLHQTCAEAARHLGQCKMIGDELGLGFLGTGMWPDKRREDLPVMPKGRYGIMLNYMPRVGSLGLDMMLRTCTIQVNLDYSSEADMVKKFRLGLALQPVGTALFANSPLTEGKPNGYKSFRSHIWEDTDPDRTGMLPFVFEDGFGYERYLDYALDVPMYFVYREGRYIDVAGESFRAFLDGKLPQMPGEKPRLSDFVDHLSTIFPEVRLKSFLEMRGADGGRWGRICALPALWVGLLYDQTALDAAWDLVRDWSIEERSQVRHAVPRTALETPLPRGGTVRDLAASVLDIASDGLTRRARLNSAGDNESGFLDPLREVVATGVTPADRLLDKYDNEWNGDVSRIYKEFSLRDMPTPQRRTLYPEIEPYESGHFDVGDGHSLYWELCGNPGGKPVVFLHGGPGGGSSPDHRRQFHPDKYKILVFDQRGCGKSTPYASLEANTTWHLVDDIEKLRTEVARVEKWQVFGGSWGSTLALAYAQKYPERATELVLRGIFLFDPYEIDWLYSEGGASSVFPDKWDEFLAPIPEAERGDFIEAYRKRLTGSDPDEQLRAAKAWSKWEADTVTVLPRPEVIEHFTSPEIAVAVARIENHYMGNRGWLEEGQLLRGAEKIRHIPGVIVQGRHDCCTPPRAAWALKKAWPEVDLQIVPDGGHLFNEPGILDGLVRATDRFADA